MIEEHTFSVYDGGRDMNNANTWTRSYYHIIPAEIEVVEPVVANSWSSKLTLFTYDNQHFITKQRDHNIDESSTIYTADFIIRYIKESTRSPIISTDNKDYLQFIISHIRNKSLTALLSE